MQSMPTPDEYFSMFAQHGEAGLDYLRLSYQRFDKTKTLLMQSFADGQRGELLDIGAHWLHQTLLYALDGFTVTAADLRASGDMDSNPIVNAIATEHGIATLSYEQLSNPTELLPLGEDRFDIIMFSEIIEHITFNPVAMWRTLYRLLKPGGRIVVTTPNYFWPGYFLKDITRPLAGRSSGLLVRDIIQLNDYGAHWKVYSARDLRDYFGLLSADFSIDRVETIDTVDSHGSWRKAVSLVARAVPLFRDSLYIEVGLKQKRSGITAQTYWRSAASD